MCALFRVSIPVLVSLLISGSLMNDSFKRSDVDAFLSVCLSRASRALHGSQATSSPAEAFVACDIYAGARPGFPLMTAEFMLQSIWGILQLSPS